MATHKLKIFPEYFAPLKRGSKDWEIRKNDRNYNTGDILVLREWHRQKGFTGKEIEKQVVFILKKGLLFGLREGFVIMSLKDVTQINYI